MSRLQRLRDRKLVQWTVAYLAGAWLLLQVVSVLGAIFLWPSWVGRSMAVLLGIGFLAMLVVAWYHGEQGRQKVSGAELVLIAGVLFLAGIGVTWINGPREVSAAAEVIAPMAPVFEEGSIAVLPFVNLSGDPEQEYFSDGLTEELLNSLAQIPELRVAARTSAFSFKDKNVPIDSIGRVLHVAHILEGSVRRSGDRIRITAQLIDAADGFHLWSETYDREVQDVFTTQDEISRSIASQLRLRLTPGATLTKQETDDPEAHNLVLQGVAARRTPTREGLMRAAELYGQAIARDPEYARAHAELAEVVASQGYYGYRPEDETYAEARSLANRSLALDPELALGHVMLGRIADTHDWNFSAAAAHFREALELNPNEVIALRLWSWLSMRLGQAEESIRQARRAVELDPANGGAYNDLASMYAYAGEHELSVAAYRDGLALQPDSPTILANLALTYSEMGRHDEAIGAALRAIEVSPGEEFQLATLGFVYGRAGRRGDAEANLAQLQALPDPDPYNVAMVHMALGDREETFEQLERAIEDRQGMGADLPVDPVFWDLRGDPRFDRLVETILSSDR